MATTPEPDRVGDIVDPLGVAFKNPLPLLLFHNNTKPVGRVTFGVPSSKGIPFEAWIPEIAEAGTLKDRVDEAWLSVKYGLISGVSIGFRALEDGIERLKSGGLKFLKTEVLELSLVPIPANASASIHTIKSLDTGRPASSGMGSSVSSVNTPVASGTPVVRLLPSRQEHAMKSTSDQILSFKSTRDQKWTEMNEIMTKSSDSGETLDAAGAETYDTLKAEVESIDKHLKRLEDLEAFQKANAKPVSPSPDPHAVHSTGNGSYAPVITIQETLPPGIGFARAVLCKTAAFMTQYSRSPVDIAKERYPHDARVQTYLKATVPAGSTTDLTWAGNLVDTTNLASEFVEFLRPATIIGKFGNNGIPSLRRVPFNVRITGQTSGGNAWWVGQGAPKPVTSFGTNAVTLLWAKLAAISVITEELARFSSPSAEQMVRDGLRDAIVQQMDSDFIDPATAAVANVSPASITNGLTPLSSAGTSEANVRTDIQNLLEQFVANNQDPMNLVLIMPSTLALALSLSVNSLGQRSFPEMTMRGGTLLGLPVITSQQAANASGSGNLVIAVNASEIFLADDGQVTVDASREASLQMLDNPTVNSVTGTAVSLVSMWQTNSIALRAERFVNWARRRTEAVSFMDDVNWGAIGSPS